MLIMPVDDDRLPLLTYRVLDAIAKERHRQESLKAAGAFPFTCADSIADISDFEKLAILTEEVGEVAEVAGPLDGLKLGELTKSLGNVARAVMQISKINTATDSARDLKKELIQVAAVAVAWAEALQREEDTVSEDSAK